jgi:hypothetical protein
MAYLLLPKWGVRKSDTFSWGNLATFKAIRYRHSGSVFADVGRETGGSAYEVQLHTCP